MPPATNQGGPVGAQFTPGPWLVHSTNRLVCQADGAFKKVKVKNGKVIGDDLPNNICLLRDPSDDFSEDETLANGFLIAAAPEGYDAADNSVARLETLLAYTTTLTSDDQAVVQECIDELRGFLAKARGETA